MGVSEESGRRNLRMPNGDELFAVVTEHNGGNHVRVQCEDGENRMGRIPGRMKYRTWISEGDVVLVEPWDWQDEKANIEWRYSEQDADQLRDEGHINWSAAGRLQIFCGFPVASDGAVHPIAALTPGFAVNSYSNPGSGR